MRQPAWRTYTPVVYWLRTVRGLPAITKPVLTERTRRYAGWVEAYARHRQIPLRWAEKGMNKEEYVRPCLRLRLMHSVHSAPRCIGVPPKPEPATDGTR